MSSENSVNFPSLKTTGVLNRSLERYLATTLSQRLLVTSISFPKRLGSNSSPREFLLMKTGSSCKFPCCEDLW